MPSLRYRAVLFDLDGTLIDSAEDLTASVRYALRRVQDRELPPDDVIMMEIGKPLEVILKNLGYPSEPADTVRFVETYRQHYAEHFDDHTRTFPSACEVLGYLREAGAKLALVTAKHQTQAEFTAREMGLSDYFDYIHGWREGLKHKPDPEPIQIALDKLGTRPEDSLVVGDTEQDVLAAKAAGVPTCAVTYGFRPLMMIRALRPDYMICRVTDLVHIVVTHA